MPGGTEDFDVDLPVDGPQGLYRIEANGFETDKFTVEGQPIPEFPTIAVPLVASILLAWGFMKKKKEL